MFQRPKSLKNKVILVTGGVSGIGRLTALLCKLKGAKVIVWDVNDIGIREMEELVDSSMNVDVSSKQKVESAAKFVLSKYGHLDVLVNNAGIVYGKSMLNLHENQIKKCFNVNVLAHFWTIQAFLPSMIKRQSGQIVTIGSAASLVGVTYLVDYCGSKFACRGLHESVRIELKTLGLDKGISFTCVMPYFINTGMFHGTVAAQGYVMKKLLNFLEPEYVANEIIRAIELEIRDLYLPYFLKISYLISLFIPYWLYDYITINQGCSLENFKGKQKDRH